MLAFGLCMIAWTVALFAGVGRGTLAPWDPPERLVVRGPYRYVRNPMITGVVSVLLGEAALFGSPAVLAWAGFVFALNAVYFPLIEEPDLRSRFGAGLRRVRGEHAALAAALQAHYARLIAVDDLAPERGERDRDQLEVRQSERDPDDRQAHERHR